MGAWLNPMSPLLHLNMSNIIIPKFPKNADKKVWDMFYKWSQDEQMADRVRANSYLERVRKQEKGIGEKHIDGLGECYASMDSRMYHRQLQNDPHFWTDPSNVKRFFKDNSQYLLQGKKV